MPNLFESSTQIHFPLQNDPKIRKMTPSSRILQYSLNFGILINFMTWTFPEMIISREFCWSGWKLSVRRPLSFILFRGACIRNYTVWMWECLLIDLTILTLILIPLLMIIITWEYNWKTHLFSESIQISNDTIIIQWQDAIPPHANYIHPYSSPALPFHGVSSLPQTDN